MSGELRQFSQEIDELEIPTEMVKEVEYMINELNFLVYAPYSDQYYLHTISPIDGEEVYITLDETTLFESNEDTIELSKDISLEKKDLKDFKIFLNDNKNYWENNNGN